MKQDNRPSNPVDYTIDSLKHLLEAPAEDRQENTTEQKKDGKIFFISIIGNNNIVTAGKTGRFISNAAKKHYLITSVIVLTLFF